MLAVHAAGLLYDSTDVLKKTLIMKTSEFFCFYFRGVVFSEFILRKKYLNYEQRTKKG